MWVVLFMVSNSLGPQADIRVGRQVGLKGQKLGKSALSTSVED
ncbi:hypothetical protein CIPAW_06G174200 [Carya illinoinensis]|uniref:Uncharacterized protein n=1 Tax=Carya illinoinensis TaxID=32201 RepID=A0A8T1QCZ1_CARIL|nr:hypothetical protein CIPAW_06G174200 [Carya illinoinensis]